MGKGSSGDPRVQVISDAIRVIPNFPKVRLRPLHLRIIKWRRPQRQALKLCQQARPPATASAPSRHSPHVTLPHCCCSSAVCRAVQEGIMFQDVTTILLDPLAFKHSIDLLVERYCGMQVDVVAGGCCPARGCTLVGSTATAAAAAAASQAQPLGQHLPTTLPLPSPPPGCRL